MNTPEELIWKYVDGVCTAAEREEVERRLQEDEVFRQALRQRELLAGELRKQELDQPSLRFARNILDKLPALYRRAVEPLVHPIWIKLFFGALALFLIGYFGLVGYAVFRGEIAADDSTLSPWQQLTGQLDQIPSQVFSVVAALSIGYLFLVLLDRILRKNLLKN